MKTETFTATAESAYGKKLDTPIKYQVTFEKYENIGEVRTANDLFKDDEVVDVRNAQKKAAARAKFLQVALDAAGIVKPTLENDSQLRLKSMADIFRANGCSEQEAREKAAQALNLEWSE